MKKRADFGSKAAAFFDSLDEKVAPVARELRGFIRKTVPNVTESIKWGVPVYGHKGAICAARGGKESTQPFSSEPLARAWTTLTDWLKAPERTCDM